MSAEQQGVELPAIAWLQTLGYTHVPGSAVNVGLRHLAPVLEDVLRPRLLALNPWLATAPGGVDAALLELGLWVRDGATPWQALVAATRHGAAICGVGDQLGTVEVGKIADLIVVSSNPLEDINHVRRLQLVIKNGRIVSDKRQKR